MDGRIKKTIPKISEESLKIITFLNKCNNGDILSYDKIQEETGVKMNTFGKSYLRTAVNKCGLVYGCIRGYGIKLADAQSTMSLVTHRLGKITSTVKKANKTQKTLVSQFLEELSPPEQKQILFIGAIFGAIKVAADNGKLIYSNNKISNNSSRIDLPNFN